MTDVQETTNERRAGDLDELSGGRVALSDGRYAWEVPVSTVSSFDEVVTAVAAQVFPNAQVAAVRTHADIPTTGSLNVSVRPHLGGASVQIHCRDHLATSKVVNPAGFALLFEAVVSSGEAIPESAPAASTPARPATRTEARPESAGATVESTGPDVPPRDAAERLTFATWAVVTGKSAKSIFATLPILDDATAEKMAARLTERAGGEITVDDVLDAETIEQLAETVRQHLEDGLKIDGLVRTLRPRAEGSDAVPVFVFHPAGGSTVAYEPLLKRLPAHTPMYGLERVEGPLKDRAAVYAPILREIQGDGPYVLAGWSFGGALAYAVAKQLRREGADVRVVGLIDTVMPGEKIEDTPDEIRARWQRYAAFAKKTYNLDAPLPYDRLAAAGSDEEQIGILMELLELSGTKIPGGIVEHQRTSWLDNRAIPTTDLETYDGDVVLYMADRYLDDQIALEPAFATRQPDGGWGEAVENLEIVRIGCDHIQIVDEPYVAGVGAHLSEKLAAIDGAVQRV
ncbi:thioesterase domain-containing protein [Prescottella agglutinans]|uniref:Thioesterase domain-containing protein n=1 Tax=Prescottella agglutinans TaxID=1644129 RepID=A0ABT6MDR0_9NOCA|nr:thioesterase domain-containing protein [Prescottella agglutinans]